MIPVLGALILQAAYGAVDLLVVGRFGSTSGLSAVSTGSQVLNLVTFVVTQFAMGITVLIARYLGEKRPEQIGSVIGGSAVVFTMIAVALFYRYGWICTCNLPGSNDYNLSSLQNRPIVRCIIIVRLRIFLSAYNSSNLIRGWQTGNHLAHFYLLPWIGNGVSYVHK